VSGPVVDPVLDRPASSPPRRPVRPPLPKAPFGMVAAAMALLGAGVLAGTLHHQHPASTSAAPTTTAAFITIKGTVVSSTATPGCVSGANGIQKGARVNLADSVGAVLGTATLGDGVPANKGGCTWAWKASVPIVSGYEIQVAGLPVAVISRTTLATQAWNIYLNDTTDSSKLINIESGV